LCWAASETGCGARGNGERMAKLRGRDQTSAGGLRKERKGRKRKRKRFFFPFFEKGNQTKFKHRFEFNQK
jgi:hypothetical protein